MIPKILNTIDASPETNTPVKTSSNKPSKKNWIVKPRGRSRNPTQPPTISEPIPHHTAMPMGTAAASSDVELYKMAAMTTGGGEDDDGEGDAAVETGKYGKSTGLYTLPTMNGVTDQR